MDYYYPPNDPVREAPATTYDNSYRYYPNEIMVNYDYYASGGSEMHPHD